MSNAAWIATELARGIVGEHALGLEARARAESPPDPGLSALYREIAETEPRHERVVETIATRYGHNPSRTHAGGLTETLGRLKDRVGELGSGPLQLLAQDLAAKANAIHWTTAWIHTFEALGDSTSARELAAILTEDRAHHEALQQALARLLEAQARSPEPAKA